MFLQVSIHETLRLHVLLPKVVVYTIASGDESEGFILFGGPSLLQYQKDEDNRDRLSPWVAPLVANNLVRKRLLAASNRPPGTMNLDSVAIVVRETLGETAKRADVTSKGWYCHVSIVLYLPFLLLS